LVQHAPDDSHVRCACGAGERTDGRSHGTFDVCGASFTARRSHVDWSTAGAAVETGRPASPLAPTLRTESSETSAGSATVANKGRACDGGLTTTGRNTSAGVSHSAKLDSVADQRAGGHAGGDGTGYAGPAATCCRNAHASANGSQRARNSRTRTDRSALVAGRIGRDADPPCHRHV